ncbi:hypothetical protein K432DRAFT_394781 [Lepidopterella palustris CBS 459.81]|uniref:Uncharacterized protein n=1 Tax=Lepidopterella palustris CBS 459.81 TaxID=1314670 RepID=A0A8E2E6T2_9PEZI|nr:hypothetical protein K432DRAFT_394781 [Lepidopterella palustris CBS 459.81]
MAPVSPTATHAASEIAVPRPTMAASTLTAPASPTPAMRPMRLWFSYQTADPFAPEPRHLVEKVEGDGGQRVLGRVSGEEVGKERRGEGRGRGSKKSIRRDGDARTEKRGERKATGTRVERKLSTIQEKTSGEAEAEAVEVMWQRKRPVKQGTLERSFNLAEGAWRKGHEGRERDLEPLDGPSILGKERGGVEMQGGRREIIRSPLSQLEHKLRHTKPDLMEHRNKIVSSPTLSSAEGRKIRGPLSILEHDIMNQGRGNLSNRTKAEQSLLDNQRRQIVGQIQRVRARRLVRKGSIIVAQGRKGRGWVAVDSGGEGDTKDVGEGLGMRESGTNAVLDTRRMKKLAGEYEEDPTKALSGETHAWTKSTPNIKPAKFKHHCIISGHLFRPLLLSSLPRHTVVKGVPSWRLGHRGKEERVGVRLECDACSKNIGGTVWQCEIPVCRQEVCWDCAGRLEEDWMGRAIGSWDSDG